ncbi:hypothetical protein ACFPU1_10260 [Thalassorhabdus alkalitolerans]|uniref:Sin domain-containing protein n=1 Tax=Thalassorhabdus alkalitolerans TaxID=2282697 RepID=A0ABW0YPW2_9BACI
MSKNHLENQTPDRREWLELLVKARDKGYTVEEVRKFLHLHSSQVDEKKVMM